MAKKQQIELAELFLQTQTLSMESVGIFHAASSVFKKLSSFVKNTNHYIADKLNGTEVFINSKFNKIDKDKFGLYQTFVEKYKYPDIVNFTVQVPDGFKGSLLDYTKLLLDIQVNFQHRLFIDVLQPFDIYIAKLVNQPTLIESQVYEVNVKDTKKTIDKYKKEIQKYLKGTNENTAKIKEVYERNKDIEEHGKVLNELFYNSLKLDNKKIKQFVDELTGKLNLLFDIISDNKNNLKPSAKQLKQISDLTYLMAECVEFYATIDTITIQLLYCGSQNMDAISRITPSKETWPNITDALLSSEERFKSLLNVK